MCYDSCKVVRMLFHYCKDTGNIYWKERSKGCAEALGIDERYRIRFNKHKAGKKIESVGTHGYIQVTVKLKTFKFSGPVHRLIWLMEFGYWPDRVDHIDRNKTNNRLENLRDVSDTENKYNVSPRSDTTSGHTGVSFSKQKGKWRAYFTKHGRQTNLGWFDDKELAIKARIAWEVESGEIFG